MTPTRRTCALPSALRRHLPPMLAMAGVVILSNVLVQHPINDWLTWGAFSYPVAFLVTDLTNRSFGPHDARRIAWTGFALAVLISLWVAPWRIALASGTAFIVAQLFDIALFNRLREQRWWHAPLIGSVLASVVDTALFFSLAFAGQGLPWMQWAVGDLMAKWAMALILLLPYRALMPHLQVWHAPRAPRT